MFLDEVSIKTSYARFRVKQILPTVSTSLIPIFDVDNGTTLIQNMEITATVASDIEYLSTDFGYNYAPKPDTDSPGVATQGALGDQIWNEINANGIQGSGEKAFLINHYNYEPKRITKES